MTAFIRTYAEPNTPMQDPFAVAVVMPTILRPQLDVALRSVFAQKIPGRIQVLIGIDNFATDLSLLDFICAARPPNCVVQVFYPGYSTSIRHGGLSPARDGGVLRCVLSYLANSPFVAYLDDDNWWHPDHLLLLREALDRADWAFSLRWFVHPVSRRPVCVDQWESVGPGKGLFLEKYGGFVDPNCLMLNKMKCEAVFPQWNRPLLDDPKRMSADRKVFDALHRFFRGAGTGHPTAFYSLDPKDDGHPLRLRLMGSAYDDAA
jgi:glycosyltransferase involved in cell wall biosynthesis